MRAGLDVIPSLVNHVRVPGAGQKGSTRRLKTKLHILKFLLEMALIWGKKEFFLYPFFPFLS